MVIRVESLCTAEGLGFTPVVVEARRGAWGPAAAKVVKELAKSKALITGEPVDTLLHQLYQSLGVTPHRETARAALKRLRACAHHTNNTNTLLNAATGTALQASDAADDANSM